MATVTAPARPVALDQDDGMDRFRELLDEVSNACSRAAGHAQGRDRAGLLMAAALLRLDMAELDRANGTLAA